MNFESPKTKREAELAQRSAEDAMKAMAEIAKAESLEERKAGINKLKLVRQVLSNICRLPKRAVLKGVMVMAKAKIKITHIVKSRKQYIYLDELRNELYRKTVVRYHFGIPKTAFWEYWDDGWEPGTSPSEDHKWANRKRPLFNLPWLYESRHSGEPIFWFEGEECCNKMMELEFVSTCHPIGSAGDWREEYGYHLTGRPVYFFPDNDEPGYQHANTMARGAFNFASEVRVVTPWRTKKKGYDATDWIKENKKRGDKWLRKHLKEFVAQAEPMTVRTSSPIERFDVAGIEKLKDPEYLVEGIIPMNGFIVIPAPFEMGKTFLALSIAKAVQSGRKFLNAYKVKQQQVAYVWAEGDTGDLKLRVASLKKGLKGEQLENFMEFEAFIGQPLLDTEGGLDNMLASLDTLETPPGLVIFDTKARTMAGRENVGEDQAIYIRAVDAIRAKYNSTVIVNDHTPLADQTRHRGHQSLGAAADTIISIEKDTSQSQGTAKVTCTKSRRGKRFEPIYIEFKLVDLGEGRSSLKLGIGLEEDFQSGQKSKVFEDGQRMLEILEKSPTLSIDTLTVWATLSGLTYKKARTASEWLLHTGKVEKVPAGKSNIWRKIQ